jgi:predicted RNA binding protein YcfA (HicA-like mRNA interferase family)
MCQALERCGWIQARITGSHHIFVKPGSILRITVPVHASHDLKLGLQLAIMKLAGLSESEL